VLFLLVAASACATPKEQLLVRQFFEASRLRDRTALQDISDVVFEPTTQGIVTKFDITAVSDEQSGSKTVTVSAPVKLPDGHVRQETLAIKVQRRADRWVITSIEN
jgi:hypothetical protein